MVRDSDPVDTLLSAMYQQSLNGNKAILGSAGMHVKFNAHKTRCFLVHES
jgi:hypothetical protein